MADGNSHFLMTAGRIDGGLAIETADAQLRQVLASVVRTGKKGTVTLSIIVSPNGEMGIEVTARVTAKAPEIQFGKSFFFIGRDGNLTREPPKYVQDNLLRETTND